MFLKVISAMYKFSESRRTHLNVCNICGRRVKERQEYCSNCRPNVEEFAKDLQRAISEAMGAKADSLPHDDNDNKEV